MRLIKNFVKRVLPNNLYNVIRNYINRKEYQIIKKSKKYWKYTPLNLVTHDLPFFKSANNSSLWVSLNRETRQAIQFNNILNLEFDIGVKNGNYTLQLGLGRNCEEHISDINIDIYIKDDLIAKIKNLQNKIWTDIRLPIRNKIISLRIETNKNIPIILSHPLLIKKTNIEKNKKSSIICIILDGLTPFYFNSGADTNTPKINDFFSDGIICGQVYSQGDWTLPAFSSMLTGVYPIKHGVYNPWVNEKVLPTYLKTLPELFNKSGYRTFGYSSHARFSPAYGHARGFERFLYRKSSLLHDPNTPMESYQCIDNYTQIITDTITHLEAHKGEDNFVLMHFFDTHYPYWPFNYFQHLSMDLFRDYDPPKSNIQDNGIGQEEHNAFITNLINSKLREIDLALDQLFSYCRKQNWYENAYFILSADHGEKSLREDEGLLLSQSRVNIPLNVRGPNIKSGRDHSLIEGNNDLFASLLHLGQIQPPSNIDGIIWPFIGGQKRSQVLSESLYVDKYQASIRTESYCYNWNSPFDQISMKIDADKSEKLIIYKRSNGMDTFNEVKDQNLENSFYKFINEHIKNNIEEKPHLLKNKLYNPVKF